MKFEAELKVKDSCACFVNFVNFQCAKCHLLIHPLSLHIHDHFSNSKKKQNLFIEGISTDKRLFDNCTKC